MHSRFYHPLVATFVEKEIKNNGMIVEIGTCMGGNAIAMSRKSARKGVSVIAVDPFIADYDGNDGTSRLYTNLTSRYGTTSQEFAKLWSDAMTWDIRESLGLCNYGLINDLSTKAAHYFKDSSVDLLFVDGLHTYDGVMADLEIWFPKVTSGGILMFHDYGCRKATCNHESVTRAVDTFLFAHGLKVTGSIKGGIAWTRKK